MLDTIIAGDTLNITYSNSEYSASTYSIEILLRGKTVTPINIKSGVTGVSITPSGSTWTIVVAASATDDYTAGDYKYTIQLTTATERYTVEEGTVTIKPYLSAMTITSDSRSHVKKVLDAIEAVIEGRANYDQMSYTIAGRYLTRMPIKDLLYLRDRYRAEYQRELDAEKIAAGSTIGGQVRFRL